MLVKNSAFIIASRCCTTKLRHLPSSFFVFMYTRQSIILFNHAGGKIMQNKTTTQEAGTIPFEHERRFFPKLENLPFQFGQYPMTYITQGYLEDGLGTRLRDERNSAGEHTYLLTRKTGEGVSRTEDEKEISEAEFAEQWPRVTCSLTKDRYFITWNGIDLQLNIFHGPLEEYVQIEVEFSTNEEAVAFQPPEWFGPEVTDDKRHGNYSLAKNGPPR